MTQTQLNALTFPFADVPAPAQAIEVADGIFWVRMPLPFALNHINLWLLRDGAGWTLVDCGFGIDATLALWEQIFATLLDGKKIQRIIVTHYHPDHVGCAGWLQQRWNCEVWMTETEYLSAHAAIADGGGDSIGRATELFRRHGLTGERLESNAVRKNNYKKGVPSLPYSFHRILEGDEISIDGKNWKVIVGRGHAPEHAMLFCAESNVLISGDQVLPKISSNVSVFPTEPAGDPLTDWLTSLARIKTQIPDDVLVLPAHNDPFHGLHARIDHLIAGHERGLARLEQLLAEPKRAVDVFHVLFRRKIDQWVLGMATGESLAHLNCLIARGKVAKDTDAQGVDWYRAV